MIKRWSPVKKLNYDFNYLNDGKAAERVFKLLTTGTI